ncbi:hypothetical protein AVEN_42768-1 [Araneus ventricosus]|uniref:Mariner Mos1 transposase n=1 Tax=Araneus ventricosus TaxID=182803 RepID=A0A4Y2AFV0_ARAVE|nr:hypothetical protein AVEN_42768-1 [Araneus ventricosus]
MSKHKDARPKKNQLHSGSECYRILRDTSGEHAPLQECRFKRFRKRLWKEENSVYLVGSGRCGVVYHELLKSSETINSARYQQQIVSLSHTLIVKRPQWVIRPILPHDNATPHTSKLVNKRLCLGSITPPTVFTRPCAVRISFVPVDGLQTVSTALLNVRRCGPMEHSLVCFQTSKVLYGWYPNLT